MKRIFDAASLDRELAGATDTVFVPTMGNLHAGHLSLVELGRRQGGPVVASIFVNPLQFGAGEDFGRYPRTLEADCAQLEAAGCDLVFAPDVAEMYPEPQTFTIQPPLADVLCGAFRPGHFAGVCTVVLKLFNLVRPRYAVFGKKDYQQLFLLRGLVRQFNLPITLLAGETGRAEDGLALSSRNGYLSPQERAEAPRLYSTLVEIRRQLEHGERDHGHLERQAAEQLSRHGWKVDYVAIRSQHTLLPPIGAETDIVILAAAHLGHTRLIDNLEIRVPV
ncbi:MAG: pantoate--beta-alanine ligase [Pseudomonadota bacterium]